MLSPSMKVSIRAVTVEKSEATEASLKALFERTFDCHEITISEFGSYYKMPQRQVITVMMQVEETSTSALCEKTGGQAIWQNEMEWIFDITQGSTIKIDGIYWLHLEVME